MAIKLSECEIEFYCAILLPLHRATDGYLPSLELIGIIERSKWLSAELRTSVASRQDTRIANRIHNVVSHRDSRKNPICRGLIEWDPETSGFSILEKGSDFLTKVAVRLGANLATDFAIIDEWLKSRGRS